MKSRILVTGKYSKGDYILYKENGSIHQKIKPYQRVRIEGKASDWIPIPIKDRKYRMLVCRKFDENKNIIEEVPLIEGKRGLWALTNKAAENGLFHAYREPKTDLEKLLVTFYFISNLLRNQIISTTRLNTHSS